MIERPGTKRKGVDQKNSFFILKKKTKKKKWRISKDAHRFVLAV